MAGSRLERLGTIFSRVTGLLRSGALKEEDRPIWYDVYKAFPPKYKPHYKRQMEEKEIRPIFYPEDVIRAKFYKKYHNLGTIDILNQNIKMISETFIETYRELEKSGEYSSETELFEATENVVQSQGISLQTTFQTAPPDSRPEITQGLVAAYKEALEAQKKS